MSKSSLRKNATKTVTTNLTIGWEDSQAVTNEVAETGRAFYIVPRKGKARFQRMLWTIFLAQNPTNAAIQYGIMNRTPQNAFIGVNQLQFSQNTLMLMRQNWRVSTSVGITDTSKTLEVDMTEIVLSRRSNLQSDDDFSIVPAYISSASVTLGQGGTLWVKETLFQENFKDDLDEWAGYTFEESAQ